MRSWVLYALICLTGMEFGAEMVASHFTESLVLLVSAYHMLYNLLSLLLLVVSHRVSRDKTLQNTFGWARIKVLGLHVNMLLVGALCFSTFLSALQTIVHAPHETTQPSEPTLLLGLGMMNLSLNLLCFLLIGGYTHHQGCSMIGESGADCGLDENMQMSLWTKVKAGCGHVFLDTSRDMSSGLTVIACACVLLLMDGLLLKYVDAILSMAAVIVLLTTTYPFVRESALILLQSIPSHIDVDGLTKRLTTQFPELLNVHDVHIWRLTISEVIATAHVVLPSASYYLRIESALKHFFLKEGISSATIQPEFTDGSTRLNTSACILQCSLNNNCGALTCCGPMRRVTKEEIDYSQLLTAKETIL